MTRTPNECVIDFPVAFAYLVVLAWLATFTWIDAVPGRPQTWPVALLWICIVGTWLNFRIDKNWASGGAAAFCISILIIAGGDRIAFVLQAMEAR